MELILCSHVNFVAIWTLQEVHFYILYCAANALSLCQHGHSRMYTLPFPVTGFPWYSENSHTWSETFFFLNIQYVSLLLQKCFSTKCMLSAHGNVRCVMMSPSHTWPDSLYTTPTNNTYNYINEQIHNVTLFRVKSNVPKLHSWHCRASDCSSQKQTKNKTTTTKTEGKKRKFSTTTTTTKEKRKKNSQQYKSA